MTHLSDPRRSSDEPLEALVRVARLAGWQIEPLAGGAGFVATLAPALRLIVARATGGVVYVASAALFEAGTLPVGDLPDLVSLLAGAMAGGTWELHQAVDLLELALREPEGSA